MEDKIYKLICSRVPERLAKRMKVVAKEIYDLISEDEETEGWLCHECAKKLDYEVEEKEIAKRLYDKFVSEATESFDWDSFPDWLDKEEK